MDLNITTDLITESGYEVIPATVAVDDDIVEEVIIKCFLRSDG